jgi:PKD repeat protein
LFNFTVTFTNDLGKGLRILLLVIGIVWSHPGNGQIIDTKCHRSTEGKEFWFGFMQGRNTSNHYVEITITSREGANFSIFIGKSKTAIFSGSVGANSTTPVSIPYALVEPTVSEAIMELGIHLVSDKPVNVYALNHDNNSSDVAVMYPIESLGKEYFTMCYTPHVDETNLAHGRNSEFVVVASEDSSNIQISPSMATDGLHAAKTSFSIKLNKGEMYQVQSLYGDLTGSYIISDKPIAVYSGSYSTTIPLQATGGWDHLFEQIPSVRTWGREYYTVPLVGRSKDYFRVMASQDKTSVIIGNAVPQILQKGQYYEFIQNVPTRIIADKPVLVAQFSQSKNNDNVTNGDGFMVIISPVSQAKNDVTFVAYQSTLMRVYFVNIVVPMSEINNIELAGSRLPASYFTPFSNKRYASAQVPISAGPWRLRDVNPDRGFVAYVYGFGGNEAYGYGVGFNLDLVLDIGKSIEFEGDTLPLCKGSALKIDAGPYFDMYRWNTKDTTQIISATTQGKYLVTASTIDGCVQKDSIYVLVSDPKTNIGEDKKDCFPYSVNLDGGSGFNKYVWNTGETSRKITASTSGLYNVTVYDKYDCPARDTMKLTVLPVPKVELSGSALYCGSKSGRAQVTISGTNESVWKNGTFAWSSNQPAKLKFKNLSMSSSEFEVTDWGYYLIYFTLTTVDGCVVNDTLKAGFFQIPTAQITTGVPGKCGDYSREITYTGNASSKGTFYWDYGGLALINDIDWKTKLVSLGSVNSNPFISLYVEENGCHSDTFKLPVGAYPNFSMDTRKSRGCDSATIYFSGKLNVPDNQLQFEWNFGDGSPVNTSQTPSHFYSKSGYFDVGLLITNKITGCQIGFTIEDMVKIFTTPVAKISTDPLFCYEDTITVIYTANIDSSFCTWKFDGAGQFGTENDSIRVIIGKPVAKIKLQVEEFGCKSKWVETTVKRKPNFDFTSDIREGCQPVEVSFKPILADANLEYGWSADSVVVSGDQPVIRFSHPGIFDVHLNVFSTETGCRDSLTKKNWILVHPKPLADFTVDYPVALFRQANLNFTNKSTLAKLYDWDFGDGGLSKEENPRHNFIKIGEYPVWLFVKSQFGCLDTADMTIQILPFDVFSPNAFRPASDIPENRVFMPVSLGVDPAKFHIQIFNRWGEMVFESLTPENKWDGKLKKGQEAPMGNYVWRADYTDIQGFIHHQKGQVLLIR